MNNTQNFDFIEKRQNPSTGIMQAQQELLSLKNQIIGLDKVNDVQSYYYSLQRNIENFERQLDKQIQGFPNLNNLTDTSKPIKQVARASTQYKSLKRRETAGEKRRQKLKVRHEKEERSKSKQIEEQKKNDKYGLKVDINPQSLYSIPLRPMDTQHQLSSKVKLQPEMGDLDAKLNGLRLPDRILHENTLSQTMSNMRDFRPVLKEPRFRIKTPGEVATNSIGNVQNQNPREQMKLIKQENDNKAKQQNFMKTFHQDESKLGNIKYKEAEHRDYDKIMDDHSQHVFQIRKGKVIQETPEFISFKRVCEKEWNRIEPLIFTLESYAKLLNYRLLKINGSKLYKQIFQPKISVKELMTCFLPSDDTASGFNVRDLINHQKNKAAIRIQAFIRMKLAKKTVKKIRILLVKIRIIQKACKQFLFRKDCRKRIIKMNADIKRKFNDLQDDLKENWIHIKQTRRIEIHYNNLPGEELKKLTVAKFEQKQNLQIGRIYRVLDPNVDMIYISSKELPNEVLRYYYKVLEMSGVASPQNRIRFMSPDNSHHFPEHFSTSGLIYYSPNSMRTIKNLVNGKNAYIINGQPCNDDIRQAVALKVPILSGSPAINSLYTKASYCYKLFEECELPLAPSSVFLYKKEEIIPNITKLIFNNFHIERWVLKIDNEVNGRGIAFFDLSSVKEINMQKKNAHGSNDDDLFLDLQDLLLKNFFKKLKFSYQNLYKDYNEYLYEFCRHGGVIQASPSQVTKTVGSSGISFFLEPNGQYQVLTTYEKIQAFPFVNCGFMTPQKSQPKLNEDGIIGSLIDKLKEKGVFGFVHIDLISFPDPFDSRSHPLFWVNDMKICYNDQNSVMEVKTMVVDKNSLARIKLFVLKKNQPRGQ